MDSLMTLLLITIGVSFVIFYFLSKHQSEQISFFRKKAEENYKDFLNSVENSNTAYFKLQELEMENASLKAKETVLSHRLEEKDTALIQLLQENEALKAKTSCSHTSYELDQLLTELEPNLAEIEESVKEYKKAIKKSPKKKTVRKTAKKVKK